MQSLNKLFGYCCQQAMAQDSPSWKKRLALASMNRMIYWMLPFARRNRFSVTEVKPGQVDCIIRLAPNRNHVGTMYAGAQFTLGELPGGILMFMHFDPQRYFPLLKSMESRFLLPARSDLTVSFSLSAEQLAEIEQTVQQKGRADYQLHGELKDQQGQVVATMAGQYQLRQKTKQS